MQRVKIAHSFLQTVKSVPLYRFTLGYVVLHMTFEELFEPRFQIWRNRLFQDSFAQKVNAIIPNGCQTGQNHRELKW